MGLISKPSVVATLLLIALFLPSIQLTEAQIGVCYGMIGNNLPSPQEVVSLYKSRGISRMRLYDPNQQALQAVRGSNIQLILDVPKTQLTSLGSSPSAAKTWVQKNVVPYASNIKYIAVGNEVMPGQAEANSVLPAMQNVHSALQSANLAGRIKVSTAIMYSLVENFPPSKGAFTGQASSFINPIVNFLKQNNLPLLANIYPYFSYRDTPSIQLNYALFTSPNPQVTDSGNGKMYRNLFDALVDTVYAALAKAGAPNVPIVVSESGWPSSGGQKGASVDNASQYYKGLIAHVKQAKGTPVKPGKATETYLFAMFDENQKRGDIIEKHFGLFNPNKSPKYQLSF